MEGDVRPWALRRLTVDDAWSYRRFRLEALLASPEEFAPGYEEECSRPLSRTEGLLSAEDEAGSLLLGAFAPDGRLLGTAGLWVPAASRERHDGLVDGVAVDPRARRRGLGGALLVEVLVAARNLGLVQVTLTVSERNHVAVRLCERSGFVRWGLQRRALVVHGVPVDKLHMTCRLDGAAGAPLARVAVAADRPRVV